MICILESFTCKFVGANLRGLWVLGKTVGMLKCERDLPMNTTKATTNFNDFTVSLHYRYFYELLHSKQKAWNFFISPRRRKCSVTLRSKLRGLLNNFRFCFSDKKCHVDIVML